MAAAWTAAVILWGRVGRFVAAFVLLLALVSGLVGVLEGVQSLLD